MIGFKSLEDVYSRAILIKVVNTILTKYKLTSRVIIIIFDNASLNRVIVLEINKYLEDTF